MTVKSEGKEEEGKDEEEAEIAVEGERQFPDAFYGPLSKKLMKDPVVDESGDSFERSFATARDDSVTYYPNRALKTIIEDAVMKKAEEGSIRGTLRSWDESMRAGWQNMMDKSAFPSDPYKPLPEPFYCPITCELINQPVIDPEGNTYEKAAAEHWIRSNHNSPMTRSKLAIKDLRPNKALQEVIDEEKEKSDESIHPSIRRWKESGTSAPEYTEEDDSNECYWCQKLCWALLIIFALLPWWGVSLSIILALLLCVVCSVDGEGDSDSDGSD